MGEICDKCGQEIKLAHKETLNKKLLLALKVAAGSIISSGRNDFDLHELVGDYNAYNNWQKLRYFGLIHHVRDSQGRKVRGHWLITRNGWAFLKGDLEVHKWVKIRENQIIERSPDKVSVRDVYRGSDVVVTTFEYFDEDGRMVGVRPSAPVNLQASLL